MPRLLSVQSALAQPTHERAHAIHRTNHRHARAARRLRQCALFWSWSPADSSVGSGGGTGPTSAARVHRLDGRCDGHRIGSSHIFPRSPPGVAVCRRRARHPCVADDVVTEFADAASFFWVMRMEATKRSHSCSGAARRDAGDGDSRERQSGLRTGCERRRPAARRAALGRKRTREGALQPGSQR
jgi:hypothetical protein